jgi:ABC-type multidrug transport system fused ATPase/permease subunit
MLASFEFGDAFLSLLWLFFLVIFFWLLITVFSDLFRDHSLSGWAKAAWILFVVILPFLGVLIYFIARGSGMQKRAIEQQKEAKKAFDSYVQEQAAAGTPAEELTKLAALHDAGKLTDEEFAAQKAKILAA